METFGSAYMKPLQSYQEQNHPLHLIDREHVDRLLGRDSPQEADLVDLARLLLRYEGFPGALDLKEDMAKILNLWGLSREMLNVRAREIWEKGFRPGMNTDDAVGSGFDTSDSS